MLLRVRCCGSLLEAEGKGTLSFWPHLPRIKSSEDELALREEWSAVLTEI